MKPTPLVTSLVVFYLCIGLCLCWNDYASSSIDSGDYNSIHKGTSGLSGYSEVKKVHIVFMNHLDVGYNGLTNQTGFINNVLNKYFQEYFERAALLAEELVSEGYVETFIYTTHPWLVDLFLHCPDLTLSGIQLQCPNDTQRELFLHAVHNGHITWHAGPMNMQPEYSPEWLFEFGLNMSQRLDEQLNISRVARVLSQRDVPGLTQAAIPVLKKLGIMGISVGVNNMTPPPAVPKLFRWRFGRDEILASWHPGGYPDNPGPDPAHPGGLSKEDCIIAPAPVAQALCFAFRTDNSGPPIDVQEVLSYYEILRSEFPGAKLAASTIESFMAAVESVRDQLPVISKETGDTWIQGAASDPKKSAEYRAVARSLGNCFKSGACDMHDSRISDASRYLLKTGEHTWGISGAGDTVHWSNDQFNKLKNTSLYHNGTLSWLEQRQFNYLAIKALQNHPVTQAVINELRLIHPDAPQLEDYTLMEKTPHSIVCGPGLEIGFSDDGSIIKLITGSEQTSLASEDHPLAQFKYITYDEKDFKKFINKYKYKYDGPGINKANITQNAHPESRTWPVKIANMYAHKERKCDLWLHLKFVESTASVKYGAPSDVWFHHYLESSKQLRSDLYLFNKTSTRMPEAIFLVYDPLPQGGHWGFSKLGRFIDPLNIVLNGSQYLHAIDDAGISYTTEDGASVSFLSHDVPIVCTLTEEKPSPSVFPVPLEPLASTIRGVAFNLYNNIWNTNYILWYPYMEVDKDFKARFNLIL